MSAMGDVSFAKPGKIKRAQFEKKATGRLLDFTAKVDEVGEEDECRHSIRLDVQAQQQLQDNVSMEKLVVKALAVNSGIPQGNQTLGEWLNDGQVLCAVANKLQPQIIPLINKTQIVAHRLENVSNFTRACRALGVEEIHVFTPVDLVEEKNMMAVLRCVHCLIKLHPKLIQRGRAKRAKPNESGIIESLESDCITWIQEMSHEVKPEDVTFCTWLKDGVILCMLVEAIRPGTIPKFSNLKKRTANMPYRSKENVSRFIKFAAEIGVVKEDLFRISDLTESDDACAVLKCIRVFAILVPKVTSFWTGPVYGKQETKVLPLPGMEKGLVSGRLKAFRTKTKISRA